MGVSSASAMHVSGPPGWADFGHRWSSGGTFASGRQGPGANCVLTISACFISYGFLTLVAHAWKRHGLPAATAVLEAKKIGRDEGFPHYRPSGVAWCASPGRRPPSRGTHFMGVRVARSVRLPPATAEAGRWARNRPAPAPNALSPPCHWLRGTPARVIWRTFTSPRLLSRPGRVRTLRVFLNGPRHRGSCGIRKSFQPPESGGRRLREVAGVDRESQERKRPSASNA